MQDKIVLITGGTKGIGYATAAAFHKEGAKIFLCARNESQLKRVLGDFDGNAEGMACDVRSESQVKQAVDECVRVFGGIDVLVNNAGIGLFGKLVEEISPDEFRAVIETNLNGTFYMCHHALPVIKNRGGGYIFNVSSLAGQNAHPRMSAYNASKFGLNGFTEALMLEARQDDVRVSLVCPGSVNTEFNDEEITDEKAWQLHADDIARAIVDMMRYPSNAHASKIELRPAKPPSK